MIIRTIVALIILLPGVLLAQYQRPGSSAAEFLNIGVNARGEAMAGAYISVVEGAEAVYYNTAALGMIEGTDISFTHTVWFADLNHEFLSIAHTFESIGSIAFSMTALYTDEMIVRTPLQPDGNGETFYAGSYRIGLSYAKALTERVSVGVTGNYLNLHLHSDFVESAYAFDIAALYNTGVRDFNFGLKISNFGSSVKFIHEDYPMPTSFSAGLSANALEFERQKLLVSITTEKPNDGAPKVAIGTEYGFNDLFYLRGGYYLDDPVRSLALGTGVNISLGSYKLRVDYSYSNYDLLGDAQRISAGFQF